MSIHFLWIAYILVAVGQVSYAVFLAARWRRTGRELARPVQSAARDR